MMDDPKSTSRIANPSSTSTSSSSTSSSSTRSSSSSSEHESSSSSGSTGGCSWFSLALIVPLVAAVLAAYGYRGRDIVLGVDLGTTYSTIAYTDGVNRNSGGLGGVVVIPDKDGFLTTPSVVAITGSLLSEEKGDHKNHNQNMKEKQNERSQQRFQQASFLIGRDAIQHASSYPEEVIIDGKRVIGRRAWDEVSMQEAERHGGRLIRDPREDSTSSTSNNKNARSKLVFAVPLTRFSDKAARSLASHSCFGTEQHSALFDADSIETTASLTKGNNMSDNSNSNSNKASSSSISISSDNENDKFSLHALIHRYGNHTSRFLLLSPETVGCLVASHLFQLARNELPFISLGKSVICIPAEFDSNQAHATSVAFRRAGFKITRTLHEPTAAAVAYGLASTPNVHYVLVFDMGGGTLDVSILFLSEGAFTVIGTAGDNKLGGQDFDDCLVTMIMKQIDEKQQQQLLLLLGTEEGAGNTFDCSAVELSLEAERVKIALSQADSAEWTCGSHPHLVKGIITRTDFETSKECKPQFERSMEPVKRALEAANVRVEEIDEIVLVGGSSRLLGVRERLSGYFNGRALRSTVDPDLAVAIGAAMSRA